MLEMDSMYEFESLNFLSIHFRKVHYKKKKRLDTQYETTMPDASC